MSAGRCTLAMMFAMVKVLPLPVIPSSTGGARISYAGGERLDRLWLAATGFKVRDQLKGAVRGDLGAHGVLKVPQGEGSCASSASVMR